MEYKDESCHLKLDGNNIFFEGRIETADYSDVSKFLTEADAQIEDQVISYDLTKLTFLNSSGIKALAIHFLKSAKKYIINIDNTLTWQRVGIVPLGKIKKEGEIVIKW